MTSTATIISPASVAKVAISSLSLFLSITHTIAVSSPTPAIFRIILVSIHTSRKYQDDCKPA